MERLDPVESTFLRRLYAERDKANARIEAFEGFLATKYRLDAGTAIEPDGTIVRAKAPEPARPGDTDGWREEA